MKWGAIAPYEETNYDIHKVFEDFSQKSQLCKTLKKLLFLSEYKVKMLLYSKGAD